MYKKKLAILGRQALNNRRWPMDYFPSLPVPCCSRSSPYGAADERYRHFGDASIKVRRIIIRSIRIPIVKYQPSRTPQSKLQSKNHSLKKLLLPHPYASLGEFRKQPPPNPANPVACKTPAQADYNTTTQDRLAPS